MNNNVQKEFLSKYLNILTPTQRNKHQNTSADYFCAYKESANICAELIAQRENSKYWYESDLEPMPEIGNIQVVTDWQENPTPIIETMNVFECKFADVTAEFAASEGEGDKFLNWWHKTHRDLFANECQEQGIQLSKNMELILERFTFVYP